MAFENAIGEDICIMVNSASYEAAGVVVHVATIGACAVIFNEEGRVLLSHRTDQDVWNLPGGGMEPDETVDETAVREVLEETGLIVSITRLIGVYTKVSASGTTDITFCFLCSLEAGELVLTDEADQHGYFDVTVLPRNTVLNHVRRIWDASEEKSEVIFVKQPPFWKGRM